MLYETNDSRWPPFTFKYCESDDLVRWRRIPGAVYGTDKYVGGPALYHADGWYYTLYLKACKAGCMRHDYPFPRPGPLAGRAGRPGCAARRSGHVPDPGHPGVHELSASDAELCFWRGKTIVYFLSGNQ